MNSQQSGKLYTKVLGTLSSKLSPYLDNFWSWQVWKILVLPLRQDVYLCHMFLLNNLCLDCGSTIVYTNLNLNWNSLWLL